MDDRAGEPPRRPAYLIAALIGMWLVGMNGVMEGASILEIVRDPFAGTSAGSGGIADVMRAALVAAVSSHEKIMLPLGLAQVMLGGLLVLVSVRALFGRRASPSFALQILLANVALLVVGYVLRQPVRGAVIDAVLSSGLEDRPQGITADQFQKMLRAKWWWSFRVLALVQLATLAFGVFALSRKTVREALRPPEPSGEES